MSTTRSVRPTDLVALVSLDGRVYLNEARTWDQLGRRPERPRLIDSTIVPWFSFATGRRTWISIQGQAILGLISARPRGNHTAWEVECLISAADDEHVVLDLFGQLADNAGRSGVHRVFLRLGASSDLVAPARRAGFVPYVRERLLRSEETVPDQRLPEGYAAFPRAASDAFALFRLYNSATPESVRRLEAASFQQWQASAEKRMSGRTKRELVIRRRDEVVALAGAYRAGGLAKIDLLVHPGASSAIPSIVRLACDCAGTMRPLLCLVPAYADSLTRYLGEIGFEQDSEYVVLVKRVAVPVGDLQPVRAPAMVPGGLLAGSGFMSRCPE